MSENEAQLDIIFYHGAYPVWRYLTDKFGIDIRDICARVAIDEPKLKTAMGEYTLSVVPDNYDNELIQSDISHSDHITFLLNCANVVFNMLKEGIIRNGDHILQPYSFQMDSAYNLYLILPENIDDQIPRAQSLTDSIKLGICYNPYNVMNE